MALGTYARLRAGWGAFDVTLWQGQTPAYATTQMVTLGTSAAAGSGIGVRKASIRISRSLSHAGADAAYIHFDILNFTSGNPDDTWTNADYTNCETALVTWMTAVANQMPTNYQFVDLSWHRTGTGVSKPNPAERITDFTDITAAGGAAHAPQVASSITFRTGVRKSWGRTYIPLGPNSLTTTGNVSTTAVDNLANSTNTLVGSLAASDFALVVVSKPLASSLNVEKVEVDDVPDIIRRRRWKSSTYKKILP